jgi:hypothetical protein
MASPTYSQSTVNTLSNQQLKVCNSVTDLPAHAWTAYDGTHTVVYNGSEYPALTDLYEGWMYNFVAYTTDTETFGGGILTKIGGNIKVIAGELPKVLRKHVLRVGETSYTVTENTPIDISFSTVGSLFGETIVFPIGSKITYRPGLTDEIVLTLNQRIETTEGGFTVNVTPNKSGNIVRLAVAYGNRILLPNDTIPPVPADLRPLSDLSQTTGAGNGSMMSYFNARIFLLETAKNFLAVDNATILSYLTTAPTPSIKAFRFPSGFRCFESADNGNSIAWTGVDVITTVQSDVVSGFIYIPNDLKSGTREITFSYQASANPNGINRHSYASDDDFINDSKTFAQYFVDYADLFEINEIYGWDNLRYGEMTPTAGNPIEVYAPAYTPSDTAIYNDPAIMNIVCWK